LPIDIATIMVIIVPISVNALFERKSTASVSVTYDKLNSPIKKIEDNINKAIYRITNLYITDKILIN
jgi:amino acid permease